MLRGLCRYVSLTDAERRLFLRAFVCLGRIDLALRISGVSAFVARRSTESAAGCRPVGAEDLQRARQYARWIDIASHHHVVPAHCLHRSLALHRWLRREGLPSDLRIGVQKARGTLKAHAWVELGGEVVNDSPAAVAAFTPLAAHLQVQVASQPAGAVRQ